jgi:hypothetical protein
MYRKKEHRNYFLLTLNAKRRKVRHGERDMIILLVPEVEGTRLQKSMIVQELIMKTLKGVASETRTHY